MQRGTRIISNQSHSHSQITPYLTEDMEANNENSETPLREMNSLENNRQVTPFTFGALQHLLDDNSIEEIWINAPNRIFIARSSRSHLVPLILSAEEIRDVTERMLAWSGRRVDLSQPFVDARLPNGARLHVVIPDITAEYWSLNIRKRSLAAFSLKDLVESNTLTNELAELIAQLVENNANILVSGATQAGKTTVLNCLLGALPYGSRLITIEEVFELTPRIADHVALQTRQVNLEGNGEVTLRALVRESLRMRPTHVVIGEIRGAESLDLLLAFNSGIPGMASIHANSASDALRKLSALPLLVGPNIVREFSIETVRTNVDLVIHCHRETNGDRRITEVGLVNKKASGNQLEVSPLARWKEDRYEYHLNDFDNNRKFSFLAREIERLRRENGINEFSINSKKAHL